MHYLYSAVVYLFEKLLPILGFFSTKLKHFIEVRKEVFVVLAKAIKPHEQTIWFHVASLGEYEQGVPVMEAIKNHFPEHKIVLTFFSPSGYTIKKVNPYSNVTVYLPLDTTEQARKFIRAVHPSMAFFIKYEFWPNYLRTLAAHKIPTYLISGVFHERQLFFKPYGHFMRKALQAFTHFFVQEAKSGDLVTGLGFKNVTVSGDTRFDRVSQQLEMDNHLDFMEEFKDGKPVLICGSTWPADEALLLPFINSAYAKNLKILIAPHQIKEDKLVHLESLLPQGSIRFTASRPGDFKRATVLILDTIGLLGRAYSYADVAYVGGAAGGTGLHNILEPATFGVSIVTGNQLDKFPEATALRRLAGLYTVDTAAEAEELLDRFFKDEHFRQQTGMISGHFVNSNAGATQKIMAFIKGQTRTA